MKYFLGVDFGGSSSKATLLSSEGKTIATSVKEYKTHYPNSGWSEQDPEDWYSALKYNIRNILNKSGIPSRDISAIALDAATHTSVLMDEDFNILRNAIYWTDQRSRKQSEWLMKEHGQRIFKLSYHYPDTIWTLPQLMWVKEEEPEVWDRFKKIMFTKDYVRYRLTGNYCTDSIEAMGSMLLDVENGEWSEELCRLVELPTSVLPPIRSPIDIDGHVNKRASKETGLSESTLVVVGTTDTAMEILAAGAYTKGQATLKLATAGRVCPITEKAYPNMMLVNYRHVVPGLWYPGTATKSSAASYRWFRDVLSKYEVQKGGATGIDPYILMDMDAENIQPGCDGLLFHPYLQGELTPYADPDLRASFTGVRTYHTKGHFNRAVLEGVAFSLKDCITVIDELGIKFNDVKIIGGGSKSPLWRQIVSDVIGLELIKNQIDDSSFGSAMLAGIAVGVFSSYEDAAQRCIEVQSIVKPDYHNNKKYEKYFELYKEIQSALAPIYRKIEGLI